MLDEPGWLDLSDRAFALLGAGAEMGPLEPLSQWGAHVVAVDVAKPRVWERVVATARKGAGTLTAPETRPGHPGVDLLTETPEVGAFLRSAAEGLPLTIGSYAYADGARIDYDAFTAMYADESAIGRLNAVAEVAGMAVSLAGPLGGGINGALLNVAGGTAPY